MTITSYAQNFEDVILWRALKHVEHGFYIDIGAQDPVVDSVSLAFYERGWRGVHVEPTPQYAEKLRAARADEPVIEAAIGGSEQPIRLFEIADTGLSTGNEEIAQGHVTKGFAVRSVEVPCMPLSQLLDAQGGRPIHWLKIDVEGMEGDVIESWSPSLVRPWIVVVESTKPNTQESSHELWEPRLVALDYEFVYFDGLNRFYVSKEHRELKAPFGPGPNFFDFFQLDEHSGYVHELAKALARRSQEIEQLTDVLDTANVKASSLCAAFKQASTVWDNVSEVFTDEPIHKDVSGLARASRVLSAALHQCEDDLANLPAQLARHKIENAVTRNDLSEALRQLSDELAQLMRREAEGTAVLRRREAELRLANEWLSAMRSSTSWRMTAPLRWIAGGPRQMLRSAVEQLYRGVRRYSVLKQAVWSLASLAPPLKRRLVKFAEGRALPSDNRSTLHTVKTSGASESRTPATPLSLRARQVFADLNDH